MDLLDRQIADLEAQMRDASALFTARLEQLISITGVQETNARVIVDRDQYRHAALWFGSAPGLLGRSVSGNESARKRH